MTALRRIDDCRLTVGLAVGGLLIGSATTSAMAEPVAPAAVVETYADLAEAMYTDALEGADSLRDAIGDLIAAPDEATLEAARAAWLEARVPYMQTEVYRFGNPLVDDWEVKVNAWPLDEGLIDYVAADYGDVSDENDYYTANVIANAEIRAGGEVLDASTIDADLLRELHEIDAVEANVATGYHAIEFLLWGQDLNYTDAGAGERPATDFDPANCTGGNCERRAAYLTTAADLLISDLEEMVAAWGAGGEARAAVTATPEDGLRALLTGLGSLSYGELAGERMKLGLLLHDPEEEHDCFSDNTHNSHYYDVVGMNVVYTGRYEGPDGKVTEGPSLAALLAEADPELAKQLADDLQTSLDRFGEIKATADNGEMAYDQMIGAGNDEGNAMVQAAIDALLEQTRSIELAVAALDLGSLQFEGSDSLDDPEAVFQ